MRISHIFAGLMLFTVAATARPAFGQNTETPLRKNGLFGTTRADTGNRDILNVLLNSSEAFESELPQDERFRIVPNGPDSGGYSSVLTTSADYTRTRRRTQLGGTLLTSFKYYPRLDRVASVGHSAGLGFTVRLPKQSSLQANSTIAYSPSYLYQLFPATPVAAAAEATRLDPDYRIDHIDSYSYGTNVALAIGPARGSRVTVTAERRYADFRGETVTRPNLTTSAVGLTLSRGLSGNSGLSVEYEYRTGTFGQTGESNEQRLSVGADYSRTISGSQRAGLHFAIAPTLVTLSESALAAALPIVLSDPDDTFTGSASTFAPRLYRLEGDARAYYDVGRSWRATVTYHRGVEFLAVLREPVFSDSARFELNGLITRRVDLSAGGAYAQGRSALTLNTSSLRTDTGQLRLRYALKRSLAIYSQYLYYYYDLSEQLRLAPDLPRRFKQHEIRVGFMLFVRPLANKGREKTTWPERTRPTKS